MSIVYRIFTYPGEDSMYSESNKKDVDTKFTNKKCIQAINMKNVPTHLYKKKITKLHIKAKTNYPFCI